MYYHHNLRANIQEWISRLHKANYKQFGNQLKYFMDKIEGEAVTNQILQECCRKYEYTEENLDEIIESMDHGRSINFNNEAEHAAFCFQLLKFLGTKDSYHQVQNYGLFIGHGFDETRSNIIDILVSPIVYFLHDSVDKSMSTIYLLEKYKKRTEWFTKSQLLEKYLEASKSYEQIFEDDLRLFLFDQGVDYPFSTPRSPSGKADIVGAVEANDPVIIEIKILDKEKNYGKARIKDGFTQIVSYTKDYNKDFGYLVLFNIDNINFTFKFSDLKEFPPMITYGNKTYFFVVINLFSDKSASKLHGVESIDISENDLLN